MRVFISGVNGNMGRRYRAICYHLGYQVIGADKEVSFIDQSYYISSKSIDRIIIATPTSTHLDAINIFGSTVGRPMLCEKPISQTGIVDGHNPLTMINQYKYLVDKDRIGDTYYDYWNTGGDGLYWDCINIIGMAKGKVRIGNDSPIWTCGINGQKLSIADMDKAYIAMVKDWVENPEPNHKYMEHAHTRVIELIDGLTEQKKDVLKPKSKVISILNKS